MPRRNPLVISGPSGTGKSTLLNKLFSKFPASFGFSVSHTTRSPRSGETEGKSYYFAEREAFEGMKARGEFIETAEFSGNCYGTSIKAVENVKASGRICVLDLEVNGVKAIKTKDLNAKYIFIQPPSISALEARLRGRNTETEDSLKKRLESAQSAIEYASLPGSYDLVVVNDDLDTAYNELETFILSNWDLLDEMAKEAPASKGCSLA